MYGWRARIAHLAPSRGDVLVYEFYRVAPEGVMLINSTGSIRKLESDSIEVQLAQIESAARDVATEQVDIIIVGGGPLVTSQGYGSEKRIAQQLTEATGVVCVTGIQLEIEALQAVGSQRPVIASPYPPELEARLADYLGSAGFEVQASKGLGIVSNSEIGLLPENASFRCARAVAQEAPQADAIFLPCARWPTLTTIPTLENDTGVPVVSATIADIYGAFRSLGVRDDFQGWGTLLEMLAP